MLPVQFLPEFHLFLYLFDSHIPECCVPLSFFLDLKQDIFCLFVKSLLIVGVIGSIVLHIATSIDSPLHSAQLTVSSIVQGSLSCFFIVKSAALLAKLPTVRLESIAIVLFFEAWLTEDVIGFIDFFEFGIIAFISIGVILFGEVIKCLLDLGQFSCVGYSEDLVIVLVKIDESLLGSVVISASKD